jgi:hypothetical protein
VVGTVEQRNLDVHHREASQTPLLSASLRPFSTAGNVLARHRAALDGIDKFVALAGLIRLHLEPDVAVLAFTAGLLDELAFLLDLPS